MPPLPPDVTAAMRPGWNIRHGRFGWGVLRQLDPNGNGNHVVDFPMSGARYVSPSNILQATPPAADIPAAREPRDHIHKDRHPQPQNEPTKRELRQRKQSVTSLLEEGQEAKADREYGADRYLREFWALETYEGCKQDCRQHFRKKLRQAAMDGSLDEAGRIRTEHCSEWMTEEEFRSSVLQGLAEGGRWCDVEAFGSSRESEEIFTTRLLDLALAFDLESDGERIWEVGVAVIGSADTLLSRDEPAIAMPPALEVLAARMSLSRILVGHNVLAWDWPIVSKRIDLEVAPLIWDTLLVQYLLEPQSTSHALGGNHRAHDDAAATLELFEKQLRRLPASVARSVLDGSVATTEELLDAIAAGAQDVVKYARDTPPDLALTLQVGKLLIVPERCLREFDWVPHVNVVAADPDVGLAAPWLQIDAKALEAGIREGTGTGLTARIALAVARIAVGQGIALRRNMLPAWLVDGEPRVAAAIASATVAPSPAGGMCVAPIPTRVSWWARADRDSFKVAGSSGDVLMLDRQSMAPSEIIARVGTLPTASMMRIGIPGSAPRWLLADRAAHVLEPGGGFYSFRTFCVGAHTSTGLGASAEPSRKPFLATRRHHVLHPGAEDQATYWTEVLRTFREFAERCNEKVPILLIGSSRSRDLVDMLRAGLAELGMGEVKPVHRSQRDHLLRASCKGLAVVAGLDEWPLWHSLADSAGIDLQPVVEALPVEEWQACDEERSVAGEPAVTSLADVDPLETDGIVAIDPIITLEKTPALVESRLHGWLQEAGLSDTHCAVVLIDSRVGALFKGSTRFVESFPLAETPLSAGDRERLAVVLSPFAVEREDAPAGFDAMEQFLVANWQPARDKGSQQVTGFKDSQKGAMEAISSRQCNVLVSLPTGEGKSVLFQVPALCRGLRNRRLTLVLSPLKALMRDQVERLREQGFAESADYLSGDRPSHEIADVIQGILDHRIVLLYVAPERLRSEVFLDVLDKRMGIDGGLEHVVVDEAHCVNQWGYEFRPDYFHAVELLLARCRAVDVEAPTPFILLSATITASDRTRLQAVLTAASEGERTPFPLLVRPESFSNPLRAHIEVQPRRVRGSLHDRREFDNALVERLTIIEQAIADARANRQKTGQRSAVLVFVSNRAHAEIVARRLIAEIGGQIDYYHAGLDSATREEIYTRFRDGELDVLVATKAFGMGMDIPDIHWIVHLSPPGYLEDFLQEVGRIGRGVKEREKAGLERLSALLLYSDRDFESIRALRARNALSLPVIKDLYLEAVRNANELGGKRVAIVPGEGYLSAQNPPAKSATAARAAATRVRMGLYWLERAGRVKLCGSIADLIVVDIQPDALKRLVTEGGIYGEVAGLILQVAQSGEPEEAEGRSFAESLHGGTSPAQSSGRNPYGNGLLGGIIDVVGQVLGGIVDALGVLFGGSKKYPPTPLAVEVVGQQAAAPVQHATPVASRPRTLALNLSQVRLRCKGLKSVGDVLACLSDIEKRGGVSLQRHIQIVPRKLAEEAGPTIKLMFDYVDAAAKELIGRLEKHGKIEFNPFEMVESIDGPSANGDDLKRRQYERAFINGFRCLARASGVRLRQIARQDDKVFWQAILAGQACRRADARRSKIRQDAQALFSTVSGKAAIPITELIDSLRSKSSDGRFRESDLRSAAGLLAAMNLVSVPTVLVPLSHVVVVPEVDGELESHSEVWDELRQVNDLAEARNLAMEVFASIDANARDMFIEGYFATTNAEELRQFLDTQLGEIAIEGGSEGGSTIISEMREKVRATKAVEFFESFKKSEEPVQWEVARAPFDQHIVVNAGPGAGKTFVLVGRIAHLIREQSIDPAQIIVLAFNRAVVFEIRRRIRDLFRSLGYAAYAGRLRVSTFHSLALRSLAREGVQVTRQDMDGLLSTFARKMREDRAFAQRVAAGARCILVDEFQDMTDEVYQLVRRIHVGAGARAGVMVIGDDDQDILRWQRPGREFSEKYFGRFLHDFGGENVRQFVLGVNFRSAGVIVDRSQAMITDFFDRSNHSRRLKGAPLRARAEAPRGEVRRIDLTNGRGWQDAIQEAETLLSKRKGKSTAVLCRSNAEVAEAHRLLSSRFPELAVLGSAELNVANLRHVGIWLDQLREAASRSDDVLSEELRGEIWDRIVKAIRIPEFAQAGNSEIAVDRLWNLCCREQAFPHLSSLIRFVEELRTDELVRLSGGIGGTPTAVISTLHKVKGLEFDNVIILPSESPFGRDGDSHRSNLAGDAAEEARLFYVGMTRAKTRLTYFSGERERSWGKSIPVAYAGQVTKGRVLVGSMQDVSLGWSMQCNAFNPDPDECQRYIENQVAVGDRIVLGGRGGGAYKSFMHEDSSGRRTQVGFLAKEHDAGGPNAELKVSAVVRFRPGPNDQNLAECVRARGWGYAVLVTGRLR